MHIHKKQSQPQQQHQEQIIQEIFTPTKRTEIWIVMGGKSRLEKCFFFFNPYSFKKISKQLNSILERQGRLYYTVSMLYSIQVLLGLLPYKQLWPLLFRQSLMLLCLAPSSNTYGTYLNSRAVTQEVNQNLVTMIFKTDQRKKND